MEVGLEEDERSGGDKDRGEKKATARIQRVARSESGGSGVSFEALPMPPSVRHRHDRLPLRREMEKEEKRARK
jgi:hypothetical protein